MRQRVNEKGKKNATWREAGTGFVASRHVELTPLPYRFREKIDGVFLAHLLGRACGQKANAMLLCLPSLHFCAEAFILRVDRIVVSKTKLSSFQENSEYFSME
jgi:hypothetical protein